MKQVRLEGKDHELKKITIELEKKEIMALVERKPLRGRVLDLEIVIKMEGT